MTRLGLQARGPRAADMALSALLLLIVAVMLVPLPAAALDLLICGNLALSLLVLLRTVHGMGGPSFSAMPAALLVATLYRLALNVSSTRLILSEAHAGEVIAAFGRFVVRGDFVVGGVLFVVLTIVQFMVIARGAERVAEVGARFSLDALPGRQLAIEAELRSGAIGHEQARQSRRVLAEESRFYGAMDGAMKFVKGDAVAAVLITAIDFAAGALLGVFQRGLPALDSLRTYGLLAIGDGLSSQVPALLIATAAGILVTRDEGRSFDHSLGQQLGRQLLSDTRALRVAGGSLLALALLPGLPFWPFALLAAMTAGLSLWRRTADLNAAPHAEAGGMHPVTVPVTLSLHPRLLGQTVGPLRRRLPALQRRTFQELGLILPAPVLTADYALSGGGYRIHIHEVQAGSGSLDNGQPLSIACTGLETALLSALRRHGHELLNLHEVRRLLEALAQVQPACVHALMPAPLPHAELLDVLRRLLSEGVSIRPLGDIIEHAAAERLAHPEMPMHALYERVRQRLGRRLSHDHARDGRLHAFTLHPALETLLDDHLVDHQPPYLGLPPDLAGDVATTLGARYERERATRPVLLTRPELRPLVRGLLKDRVPDLPVLSVAELAPDLVVDLTDPVPLPGAGP